MRIQIRRLLLTSIAGLAVAAALPVVQTSMPTQLSSAAFARGGHDDGGGDSHGGSGSSSGSGRSGSDDHGGSGRDDHGRGRDDAADHDRNDDNPGQHRGRDNRNRADRPEITLTVSDSSLQSLLNGSSFAVDQLGRRLEIEVELEHGVRVVKAQVHRSDAVRNPGAITSVEIVPASVQ